MDAFNENSNEQQAQQPMGCLHRFSKTIKVVIIGLLILLLMIPMFMIENLISERGRTQEEAIDEVSEKWSLAQTITGPYLNLQYPVVTENNGEKKVSIKDLILFPDELTINGQLKTEILKRSIYEVNVYQSELTLKAVSYTHLDVYKRQSYKNSPQLLWVGTKEPDLHKDSPNGSDTR